VEIRQVQYFLAIVETGSFSAAAENQYISQSSLSKKIIALEKELGITLFDRSKQKISLTDAGKAFLEHARKLDGAHKAMSIELNEYKSTVDTLFIATIPVIAQYGITTHIAQFRDLHPDIKFNLQEIDGLNILTALAERQFDLAITRHNYLDHNQFTGLEIFKDKLVAVVSKRNRYSERASISLRELSNDNFIVFDKVTELHKLIMDECKKAGFEPTIFYSSHGKVSVFSLVGANIGLALMPVKIFEYHQNPDVLAIPLDETIECNIVLVYPKHKKLSWPAKAFTDFLQEAS